MTEVGWQKYEGFYGGTHLPSNAKGVIFVRKGLEKPLELADFEARDETSGTQIQVAIRPLTEIRKVLTFGFTRFRIEPRNGFVAGHNYKFTLINFDEKSGGQKFFNILVDKSPVDLSSEKIALGGKTSFGYHLPPLLNGGQLEYPTPDFVLAQIMELNFVVPDQIERYSDSIDFLLEYSSAEGSRLWGMGDRKEVMFIACDQNGPGPLSHDIRYKVHGLWSFLEVDDSIRETPNIDLLFDSASAKKCKRAKARLTKPPKPQALESK